jgi:hypothetical protein
LHSFLNTAYPNILFLLQTRVCVADRPVSRADLRRSLGNAGMDSRVCMPRDFKYARLRRLVFVRRENRFLFWKRNHMRSKLHFSAGIACVLAASTPLAIAQNQSSQTSAPAAQVRITTAVNNSDRVTMTGDISPMAQTRYDQGPAATGMATGKIELLLARSAARQEALREYLGSLQNPHSANYHKWLTPQQYGAQFGVSPQDVQTVETWLRSQGFQITSVPASANFIQFSGTVGGLEQAFRTSMHSYDINGTRHIANASAPSIPAALASVVAGLSPLNDFRAQPQHLLGERARVELAANGSLGNSGRLKVLAHLLDSSSPQYIVNNDTGETLYVTPADAATIYDAPNALNSNFAGSTKQDGTGVNIGFAEYSDLAETDYLNYRKVFLGETTPPAPNQVIDGTDPGVLDQHDGQEALIDAEIAAGLAPGANIYIYSSQSDLMENGVIDAAIRAIQDNTVDILGMSYSTCEEDLGSGGNYEINELWQEAAAQGITVVAATGDSGSAACDATGNNTAHNGLAVNGYASTPYDVAVGGTDFDTLGLGFSNYLNSSNTANAPTQSSVTGYIPENPWNDSITNNPPDMYDTNIPGIYGDGEILVGTGGGASSTAYCSDGTIDFTTGLCSGSYGGYPAPPFQSGLAVPPGISASATPVRYLPDVSLFAGTNQQYPSTWALCSDSTTAQAPVTFTDCSPGSDGTFTVETAGGTATSTAAFTGVLGMVVQSLGGAGHRLGVADNVLYNLHANNAGIFHDVTAGNNSMPCADGSPDCGNNNFENGYNAAPGYDLASGLGSVDISRLVAAWASAAFTTTSITFDVNGNTAPINVTHGTTVTLATAVTPSDATGTVSVTGLTAQGALDAGEYIPLTGGAGSISVNDLPGSGSTPYSLTAYYPGDATHSPIRSAPVQVTVSPEASTTLINLQVVDATTLSPINPPNSFSYGSYGFAYVQPQSAANGNDGTPTGSATLTGISASAQTQPLNSKGTAAFPLQEVSPGTYTLTAAYSGDASYKASTTSAAITISISKAATKLSAASDQSSIDASASATVTVTLTTDSSGAFPTGNITLQGNGNSFASTTTQQMLTPQNVDEEIATFTVPGSALVLGANTLTAAYPGDTNYGRSAATPITITVTGIAPPTPTPTFMLTPPVGGITVPSLGVAGTGTLTVTPLNGFTGTVNLSCAILPNTGTHTPTCTVDPSVTLTSITPATATITVDTTTGSAALRPQTAPWGNGTSSPLHRLLEGSGGLTLCALLLWIAPARRRALRSLLVILLAFGTIGMIGCGTTVNGTKAGAYSATITGTSGSIVVTQQVVINVP